MATRERRTDQIRRGLPPFLEGLPDADPQLAELASPVDIDRWDQIAEPFREPDPAVMLWTTNRKYRAILDEVLSVARRQAQDGPVAGRHT